MSKSSYLTKLLALVAAFAFIAFTAVACGGDDDSEQVDSGVGGSGGGAAVGSGGTSTTGRGGSGTVAAGSGGSTARTGDVTKCPTGFTCVQPPLIGAFLSLWYCVKTGAIPPTCATDADCATAGMPDITCQSLASLAGLGNLNIGAGRDGGAAARGMCYVNCAAQQ